MSNARLTQGQRREIADRFVAGDEQEKLAEEFKVCKNTIVRVCRDLRALRPKLRPAKTKDLTEFATRAKSILWRQDGGTDRKTYEAWKARVEELASKDGGGLAKNEAIVRASKEYPCLGRLFREYDVRAYDPNPESHAHIQHAGTPIAAGSEVTCEGIDQTYRESLRWAGDAAGMTTRTGVRPSTCPCDFAWYLYEQAISDPKDFLSRVGQVEAKGDQEAADRLNAKAAGTMSIAEIDGMLAELKQEEEEENEDEQNKMEDSL